MYFLFPIARILNLLNNTFLHHSLYNEVQVSMHKEKMKTDNKVWNFLACHCHLYTQERRHSDIRFTDHGSQRVRHLSFMFWKGIFRCETEIKEVMGFKLFIEQEERMCGSVQG